jgi:hypothetical protein
LDEIGQAVYEEMSLKVKVYGRKTDGLPMPSFLKALKAY